MSYKVGDKVPYKGIYRCRQCGQAKEYDQGEIFSGCPSDPGEKDIRWTLIEKE